MCPACFPPAGIRRVPGGSRTPAALLRRLARIGAFFPRNVDVDDVVTRAAISAPPEEVWRRIMFYEEVPHRPGLVLRLLLPLPLRTSKPGLCPGVLVKCSYSNGGRLIKRITAVEPPSVVRFVVLEQHLGVENYLTAVGGAYLIRPSQAGSEVALTTTYRGHLRPRWLWRTVERRLAHSLHRHILRGMGA